MRPTPLPQEGATEKVCTICKITKPLGQFYKKSAARDGLCSWCKPCVAEKNRDYSRANSEAATARATAWVAANPDRAAETQRRRYERHGAEIRDRVRQWRQANPSRVAEYEARRRARLVTTEVVDLAALWNGLCGICDAALDGGLKWPDPMSKSVDHVIPLARGGTHTQGNLQWAHLRCNSSKGSRIIPTSLLSADCPK